MKLPILKSRLCARAVALIVCAILIGFGSGIAFDRSVLSAVGSAPVLRVVRESDINASDGYVFTDPLISVSVAGDAPSEKYLPLQQAISSFAQSGQAQGVSSVSVYFRDIDASEGFTINPQETYDPASLTKVPLAMAYYDLAENDPSILDQQILYSGVPNLDAQEQVRSATQFVPGTDYTVESMLEHLLEYSDNNAEQLLANHLTDIGKLGTLLSLFKDLGFKLNPDDPDYMTVRSYAIFFRVLYNATYLDRDYSEKTLSLLSKGDFAAGIRAGVPAGMPVAEKFGDARIPDQTGAIVGAELHDCGIVYYPDHPYILCVMTKGSSVQVLEKVIAQISALSFAGMQKQYGQASKP